MAVDKETAALLDQAGMAMLEVVEMAKRIAGPSPMSDELALVFDQIRKAIADRKPMDASDFAAALRELKEAVKHTVNVTMPPINVTPHVHIPGIDLHPKFDVPPTAVHILPAPEASCRWEMTQHPPAADGSRRLTVTKFITKETP